MSRRIAVGIEYDGGAYSGWQTQSAAPSIQSALEAALGRVADAKIEVVCAGRTDSGVHARAQVAHFDTQALRTGRAWVLGTNAHLPRDISLQWALPVPDHFHARYSALLRTYRYVILNRAARSALAGGRALLVHKTLDAEAMHQGAQYLIGEHDFSAFRSAECQANSPIRRMHAVSVSREADWVAIEVTANAFLHHMVRNIAGLLIAIGLGRATPERAREQLESRRRSTGEATAAAVGLYFWRVEYPLPFNLPDSAIIAAPLTGTP